MFMPTLGRYIFNPTTTWERSSLPARALGGRRRPASETVGDIRGVARSGTGGKIKVGGRLKGVNARVVKSGGTVVGRNPSPIGQVQVRSEAITTTGGSSNS